MQIDDQTRMAFQFASDLAKQLISISSGVLALTITFIKEVPSGGSARHLVALRIAWLGYFVSIFCGICALSALTGAQAPLGAASGTLEIPGSARLASGLQFISFVIGTLAMLIYGLGSISARARRPAQP